MLCFLSSIYTKLADNYWLHKSWTFISLQYSAVLFHRNRLLARLVSDIYMTSLHSDIKLCKCYLNGYRMEKMPVEILVLMILAPLIFVMTNLFFVTQCLKKRQFSRKLPLLPCPDLWRQLSSFVALPCSLTPMPPPLPLSLSLSAKLTSNYSLLNHNTMCFTMISSVRAGGLYEL